MFTSPSLLMDVKLCGSCGQTKPTLEFYANTLPRKGFSTKCKICTRVAIRKNRQKNSELEREAIDLETSFKRCRKCKEWKRLSSFNRNRTKSDGFSGECKNCSDPVARQWAKDNPERKKATNKIYHEQNADRVKIARHLHYVDNRESILARNKTFRDGHKDQLRVARQAKKEIDPDRERKRNRKWEREMRTTNIGFKLRGNLRRRLGTVLKNKKKNGSAVSELGCTVEDLRNHLESRFTAGMSWENYGKKPGQWSIDHIMPLTAFNLEEKQHFLLANFYLNLRPLWHIENCSKNDKIPYELLQAA